MTEKILYSTIFGSRLFGTALPTSDTDYKGVFIPAANDIIAMRDIPVINRSTGSKSGKNVVGDVDEEFYSLKEFMKHLANGQTNALDILFSTNRDDPNNHPLWNELYDNRHRVLSKKADSFVGYCVAQSNKYNFKIERFNKVDHVLKQLIYFEQSSVKTLGEAIALSSTIGPDDELLTKFEMIQVHSNGTTIPHLNVCGKKVPHTHTLKEAIKVYQKMYDDYGHRAKNSDTKDWKSVYHAVRIAEECIELLSTGNITLPRPNADYLIKVRLGEIDFEEVSQKIVDLVAKIDTMDSVLPDAPDRQWMNDFVFKAHLDEILTTYIGEC